MFDESRVSLRIRVGFAVVVAAMLLASCGGDDDAAADDVATLEVAASGLEDAAGASTEDDSATQSEPDEAALEFSQCMRDEGLDFPDLSVDANGEINLRAAFQDVDRSQEGFREALEACGETLQDAGFGGGRRAALESTAVQDALLDFSQCVRDAGYDVGDLTLGQPGQGQAQAQGQGGQAAEGEAGQSQAEDGERGQQGQRQGGFGNREARFATNLGLDYEDPDVAAVIDGCAPIIDEAFTAAGIGQPQG